MTTKTNQFDYPKFQLAVSIFQYAEALGAPVTDASNLPYLRAEAAKALTAIRAEGGTWSPKAETARGKKLAGRVAVTVETHPDTSYGFSYYPQAADAIYTILRAQWLAFIHGAEIDQVLDARDPEAVLQ